MIVKLRTLTSLLFIIFIIGKMSGIIYILTNIRVSHEMDAYHLCAHFLTYFPLKSSDICIEVEVY